MLIKGTHPDRTHAQQIAGWEGDLSGTGLTWHELVRLADSPPPTADGVQDTAARLLLVFYLRLLEANVTHAGVSDLIFHPPAGLLDTSAEQIVDEALRYRPIAL